MVAFKSEFELVFSLKCKDLVTVNKYKSKNTGLIVFIADVSGPIVKGHFAIVTETFDGDGLPHTLEHLIFVGSEKYPYKGILDLLANRCLANGTNAWTDTDNTVYTIETVGSEGFLTLLPVYIEHILYPTLTDSAYLTEVHHVDGEGKDAGVVYCEMQAHSNVGEEMLQEEMEIALYPGKCGYKSYTGGHIENLRESTSNEKVRAYHKHYYRPDNLYILISGQINAEDVFKALRPVEEKLLSQGAFEPIEKPWQTPIQPFEKNFEKVFYYPSTEEKNGLAAIGWRIPSATTNHCDLLALNLLLKYLTDTSASPLQKAFVEIDDPYASDIDYDLNERLESVLGMSFENVPLPKIGLIKDHLIKTLREIVAKEDGIDAERMTTVINRSILKILSCWEKYPHDQATHAILQHILNGKNTDELDQRLNKIDQLEKLKSRPLSYWKSLIEKYLISAPYSFIQAIPSMEKLKETTELEKKRIKAQQEALGPEGLKRKEQELLNAKANNEIPIPDGIVSSIPIPGIDSISFYHVDQYNSESVQQHSKLNLNSLPFYTYLDHCNTNFIYLNVFMDTSTIPVEHKPYIPLILESILESPVDRNGELIPYEKIVAELESDTIAICTRLGDHTASRFSPGNYAHYAVLSIELELDKYEKSVKWIKDILYQTKFTAERLKIISTKIINDVAQEKRRGPRMAKGLWTSLMYKKESIQFTSSAFRQQDFLQKLVSQLGDVTTKNKVLSTIESVRNALTATRNIALHMAVNVDKLAARTSDVYLPWGESFGDLDVADKKSLSFRQDHEFIIPFSEIPLKGCVTGSGSEESAFLYQCCPTTIKDFNDLDVVSLLVCLQYFTQLEGPMWREIRGPGLTYSYGLRINPSEGLLYLLFYRSTNVIGAFVEAKKIIENQLKDIKWDNLLIESAKASLVYNIVSKEGSIVDAINESIMSRFKKVPSDFNKLVVQKVFSISLEDLSRVALKYLKPLFDPNLSKTVVLCHTSKTEELAKGFKTMGFDLQVYNSLEDSYLNRW